MSPEGALISLYLFGYGVPLIPNLIGFAYPAYLSHQATLDSVVNNLSDKAKNMADTVTKEGLHQHHLVLPSHALLQRNSKTLPSSPSWPVLC
ncbi:hypothetical protein J4Q44_G00046990 [Coregonus suidteri]|uniref:Uncharacterized protein n=1 Tax=Coregonus suidteri TaxID=861788 RepID=A0AAN8RF88_9TELE